MCHALPAKGEYTMWPLQNLLDGADFGGNKVSQGPRGTTSKLRQREIFLNTEVIVIYP